MRQATGDLERLIYTTILTVPNRSFQATVPAELCVTQSDTVAGQVSPKPKLTCPDAATGKRQSRTNTYPDTNTRHKKPGSRSCRALSDQTEV
ncbi:MAG: hypothetical protein COA37_16225 [Hoeflea sp.]|nr:MAG: hypothetical protein COA37_16225 [Hoeflea sp.]